MMDRLLRGLGFDDHDGVRSSDHAIELRWIRPGL
jgi:hypothetical protein